MYSKYQRGELSLLWVAVFIGAVMLVAMVALMSARYEHNYFADAWKRITGTEVGKILLQTQQAAGNAVKPEAAAVSKCMVGGKVIYSNVECDAANPANRKVELYDTKGFEAPKTPEASTLEVDSPQNLKEKMIEKAVQRHSREST